MEIKNARLADKIGGTDSDSWKQCVLKSNPFKVCEKVGCY
jgi:hypothetical protein